MRWPVRMRELDPLVEETIVAACTMAVFGCIVTLVYWLVTGHSPWPGFALGEVAGFGFGTAMLALTAPKRRR